MEALNVNGIEVQVSGKGEVFHREILLGRVGREERLGQWFWRAYRADTGEPYRRYFTSRPEAIRMLLIDAEIVEGIGF